MGTRRVHYWSCCIVFLRGFNSGKHIVTIYESPLVKVVRVVTQGSHGIENPGKSREFVLVFFPGLEVWNFVEKPGIFT